MKFAQLVRVQWLGELVAARIVAKHERDKRYANVVIVGYTHEVVLPVTDIFSKG